MSKGVDAQVKPMGIYGRAKKASRSRDILLALEGKLAKLEGSTGDVWETFKKLMAIP